MSSTRSPYPSDVTDEEWAFVAPYLTLLPEDVSQRRHNLREVYNGVRYIIKTGAHWRMLPHDLPPWPVVYQQMRRWLAADCFENVMHDLRLLLRRAADRPAAPTAVILDSRTLQSTPTSGARAGYDGAKRRKGSKVHAAVDTLGELLAVVVTPANEQDRAQVEQLAAAVQDVTGERVEVAWVDQGYTGDAAAEAAHAHGIQTVSSWWWSSCQRPSVASSCCPAAGSWSAVSPGLHASAAWRVTTNGWRRRWRGSISSPFPRLRLSHASSVHPFDLKSLTRSSWVSASPTSGSVAAGSTQNITLTFNTPSTTPQTYSSAVNIAVTNGTTPSFSVPINVVTANVSKQWYFAEGYTGGSFSEFLTLANPNNSPTNVTVTYLLQGASPITKVYAVNANARRTITVNNEVGANQSVSMSVSADQPIVAERPMYFTYTTHDSVVVPGGSDVLGATQLGQQFDFGYLDTTAKHDTFLTVLNPNSATMNVSVTYYPSSGSTATTIAHTVAANSRGTIKVYNEGLAAGSYSALVSLDQPGLVERPMYLQDATTTFTGSSDVIGVQQLQTVWNFAEGFTGNSSNTFHETYILSNPNNSSSVNATVTFYPTSGSSTTQPVTIPANGQVLVDANALLGTGVSNSVTVTAPSPILAERYMSFQYNGIPGATDVLGTSRSSNLFLFAEGYTGGSFSEYLTVQNANSSPATVTVEFLLANGSAPIGKSYTVPAHSRFTLNTTNVVGQASFSMVVVSNQPIVAERPMYFNYANSSFGVSGQTGGSDVIGYQP